MEGIDEEPSEATLLGAAFSEAPIAMAVTDNRGRYVDVNRAMYHDREH